MAITIERELGTWTAEDLVCTFGPIPLYRIRHDLPPGTATEQDLIEISDSQDRLYDLIDGVLVLKTAGIYESYLAARLLCDLGKHVKENKLGIVLGADGMVRLAPGRVRTPDGCFISWARLRSLDRLHAPFLVEMPELVIEVISGGNTEREMSRKLDDYFAAAVQQVWYIYPQSHEVHVYASARDCTVLHEDDTLSGEPLLPGFKLSLRGYFAQPSPSS